MGALPRIRSLLCLLALLCCASIPDAARASEAPELIVGVTERLAESDPPGRSVAPRMVVVRSESPAAERLLDDPGVLWVEPNRTFRAAGFPNDRLFSRQFALAEPEGVGAPSVWWASRGDGATIAVLDSGVDLSHPDLAPNLWHNPREVPANGIDDDLNGFVDDVHGADVISADGDPRDEHGHGTAMAGVAAARGGNGLGVSGVAPEAQIMAVKVLSATGAGTTDTVVSGIRYATAQGADVINLSLNGPSRSRALDESIAAAEAAGVTVVASAGNDALDRDTHPSYPASSAAPNLISVAAGSRDHGLAAFSGYGRVSVDLAAPGEGILTTGRGGGYVEHNGTSPAAAHVSGAVALLAAARPDASPAKLRAAILAGTRPLRHDASMVARGELDAARSLNRLRPDTKASVQVIPGERVGGRAVTLSWRVRGTKRAVAAYRLSVGSRRFALNASGSAAPARRRRVKLAPGRHAWRVEALDAGGRRIGSASDFVRVPRRHRAGARGHGTGRFTAVARGTGRL